MTDLKKQFLEFIRGQKLFEWHEPVLLAVSGGIDSTVMAHLFHDSGLKFGLAHVNFQLRGIHSEQDEYFVRELSTQFGVKFFSIKFETETYAAEHKISIQMAARALRYPWLEQVRKDNGFYRIATAHHTDDSIETVLINIFRGTGIHGLGGISPKKEKMVRPLLCFNKKEIQEYASINKIAFRQDQSNAETIYERNKIRLEVIPSIEIHFPAFKKTISENISKWKDAAVLYDEALHHIQRRISTRKEEEFLISIGKLKTHPAYKTILFEMLKEFTFGSDQVNQIAAALDAEPGKMFYSPTHRLVKDRKNLIVTPISGSLISAVLIEETDRHVMAGSLKITLSHHDAGKFSIPVNASVHCLDWKELEFPLMLRKWKPGDYFYPLGMKMKKKKISNYLVDRKIPLPEKENVMVLESGKRIACILGERIDERFKITPSTTKIVMIGSERN